ncbi:MAG: hypothetical protein AB7T22_17000 [Calditrichaceae bacterium]
MRQYRRLFILSLFIITLCEANELSKEKNAPLSKVAWRTPSFTFINVNNISGFVLDNGSMSHNPAGGQGMFFPRGTGVVVFAVVRYS